MKNKKYLLFLLLIPIIIIIGRSFALPISGEIKSIEIHSDNYNNAGSFNIIKTVDWKESGKAEIAYTLSTIEKTETNKYKDIILVLDKSNSMNEGKLEKARDNSIELIRLLLDNLNNRVALITFDTTATIKSNLTNNKEELIDLFGSINIGGKANFNNALLKVDELLNDYDKLDDHDLIVLFLTDGNPNEGIPNDQASYGMLKDKYPYININAIQYEEDIKVVDGIKNISDNQFIASDNNILTEAILTSIPYEKLIVSDIINNDNFNINSIDDIKTNNGTIELTNDNNNQKIVWNLNNIKSGVTSKMVVTINLKNELINQNGLYTTNKSTSILSKINGEEKTKTSDSTLALKNKYNVTYNINKPGNCSMDAIPGESYFVGDTVTKKTSSLYCDGYYLQSWIIKDSENVKYINNNTFTMPSHDITISAVWVKSGIEKSMDGVVLEKVNTLYRVLQDAALDGTYAKEYTGPHMDSNTQEASKAIYHWYVEDKYDSTKGNAIYNMNNVKFGDYCWKMIRTTDTGGVRLLYNGKYNETTKCQQTNNIGGMLYSDYGSTMYLYKNSSYYSYYYGTDYTYDEDTHQFKLAGDIIQMNLADEENFEDYMGWYTCHSSTSDECSTLYRLFSIYNQSGSSLDINVINMTYSSYANQSIGRGYYNVYPYRYTFAGGSYMLGDDYIGYNSNSVDQTLNFGGSKDFIERYPYSSSYYVSDEIEESYTSYSTTYYRLKNPVSISSISNRRDLIGKYYNSNKTGTFTQPKRIADVDDYNIFYLDYYKSNANINGTYTYTYYDYITLKIGDSVSRNDDGTYSLNNVEEVSFSDFFYDRTDYIGKYLCEDGNESCYNPWKIRRFYCYECDSTYYQYGSDLDIYYLDSNPEILIAKSRNGNQLIDTLVVNKLDLVQNISNYSDYHYTCGNTSSLCDDINYVRVFFTGYYSDSSESYLYTFSNKYYYGSDVTWDGTKYTLVDPVEVEVFLDLDLLKHHHFVCISPRATSCEQVGYIYYSEFADPSYNKRYSYFYYMTLSNGNTDVSSAINSMIKDNKNDSYIKTVIDYWYSENMTKYTDYLEDSIYCNNRNLNLDNWNPDGGGLMINSVNSYSDEVPPNLSCPLETDRFSMDNPKAHLTYPVGLLSVDEIKLFNNQYARKNNNDWLTMSPYFYTSSASIIVNYSSGYLSSSSSYNYVPAITLKYGTEYISGNGSDENPYVVDTSEVDGQ